jgi:hypothetical protein
MSHSDWKNPTVDCVVTGAHFVVTAQFVYHRVGNLTRTVCYIIEHESKAHRTTSPYGYMDVCSC